jgi:hypothetical protein
MTSPLWPFGILIEEVAEGRGFTESPWGPLARTTVAGPRRHKTNGGSGGAHEMYKHILSALLVFSLTSSWANAGLAASIQRATPPVIASATVDADRRTMVVSGWHFGEGSAVVALGDRVLRIKSHSDSAGDVCLRGFLRGSILPPMGHLVNHAKVQSKR